MANLSICNIENVLAGAESCEESFSGTGSRIYLALVNNLHKADVQYEAERNRFVPNAFRSLMYNIFAWDIEPETGEATYETNPGGGGFYNKIEVTIRQNMDLVSHSLRALNNLKFLVFVPDGKNGYYVYYSVMGSAKLESSTGTTGKAASDEHGHTVTVSANPMLYPFAKWYPVDGEGNPIDLDDWLATKAEGKEFDITFSSSDIVVKANGIAITTGSKVPMGATITVEPASSTKKLSTVSVGGTSLTVGSDGKASFIVTANSTITATTATK